MGLIRGDKDYDPDKIVSRLEHFWSGHGSMGQNMVSPYDTGLRSKSVDLTAGDSWASNRKPISESFANVHYEGSLDPMGLHSQAYPEGGMTHSGWRASHEPISKLSASATLMTPILLRRAVGSPLGADYTHASIQTADDQPNRSEDTEYFQSRKKVNPVENWQNISYVTTPVESSEDEREANTRLSEAIREMIGRARNRVTRPASTELFTKFRPHEVAGLVGEHIDKDFAEKVRKLEPGRVDPRYLRVTLPKSKEYRTDVIDLQTGTWAKISPDQFFPH